MRGRVGKSTGPGAPMKVPAPGATSAVGPKPPALRVPPQPRTPNTRDYGKQPAAPLPQPSPFGPPPTGGAF